MTVLSQTAQYALQAAVRLAQEDRATVEVGALAEALQVPRNYLSKTLTQLARVGVLESVRGKRGGFRLARPATEISLHDVIEPFERIADPRRCLMGRPICREDDACAAHHGWQAIGKQITTFFQRTTLADLARGETRWPNRTRLTTRPRI